jgi:hypothetical protein
MKWTLLIVIVCVLVTGCATTPKNDSAAEVPAKSDSIEAGDTDFAEFDAFEEELSSKTVKMADPLESWNRLCSNQ